jgi:hypothetical protein
MMALGVMQVSIRIFVLVSKCFCTSKATYMLKTAALMQVSISTFVLVSKYKSNSKVT